MILNVGFSLRKTLIIGDTPWPWKPIVQGWATWIPAEVRWTTCGHPICFEMKQQGISTTPQIRTCYITGWWLGHPSEKYESQLGWLFPIYGKIKHGNQTTNQIILPLKLVTIMIRLGITKFESYFPFNPKEFFPFHHHRMVSNSPINLSTHIKLSWNPHDISVKITILQLRSTSCVPQICLLAYNPI